MPSFRTSIYKLVPRVFLAGDGERVYYSLGVLLDAFADRMLDSLRARFPRQASKVPIDGALELTGGDRGIFRGRNETDAHYAERLVGWRYPRGHRTRGSAFALLAQAWAYFGAALCWTIDRRGTLHTRDALGSESFAYGYSWDWDGTDASPQWARFWLAFDGASIGASATPAWGDAALWGGGLDVEGYCVGIAGVKPADFDAIKRLIRPPAWKPAGTRAEWIIVSLDSTIPGAGVSPDATWGHWSRNVAGVQTATRYANWRYIAFSAERNVYGGNKDNFPTSSQIVGGGTYGGNKDNFPTSATLPDGSTYAGNAANFPVSTQLVDDG